MKLLYCVNYNAVTGISNIGKINLLRIVSPCILVCIYLIIGIIDSIVDLDHSGGWSMLGVIIGFPFLLLFIGIDITVKTFTQGKTLALWLIEAALIILSVILFQYYRTH